MLLNTAHSMAYTAVAGYFDTKNVINQETQQYSHDISVIFNVMWMVITTKILKYCFAKTSQYVY